MPARSASPAPAASRDPGAAGARAIPPPVQPPRQRGRGHQRQQRADDRGSQRLGLRRLVGDGRRSPAPSRLGGLPARPRGAPPRSGRRGPPAAASSPRGWPAASGSWARSASCSSRFDDLALELPLSLGRAAATSCLARARRPAWPPTPGRRGPPCSARSAACGRVAASTRMVITSASLAGSTVSRSSSSLRVSRPPTRATVRSRTCGEVMNSAWLRTMRPGSTVSLAAGVQVHPDHALVADRLRRRPHVGREPPTSTATDDKPPVVADGLDETRPFLPFVWWAVQRSPCIFDFPSLSSNCIGASVLLCAVHTPYVGAVG